MLPIQTDNNSFKNALDQLESQWHAAAEKDFKTAARMELYEVTERIVKHLKDDLAKEGCTEKIIGLCNSIITGFSAHSIGENEMLADWIARHSGHGLAKELCGAYQSLHELFKVIAKANGCLEIFEPPQRYVKSLSELALATIDNLNSPSFIKLLNIAYIDAAALGYAERRKLDIVNCDIKKKIFSYLDERSKKSMHLTSSCYQRMAALDLIEQINLGNKTIKNLGIKSIADLIEYFGEENCLKITRLDLANYGEIDKKLVDEIAEKFPKLLHLSLKHCDLSDETAHHLVCLDKLVSLDLSECNKITHLGFLLFFLNLKDINLSGCSELKDIGALVNCSALKKLNIGECQRVGDASILKRCTNLQDLNLEFCTWVNDSTLLSLPHMIKTLSLRECNNINDLNILEHCEFSVNLNGLILRSCRHVYNLDFMQFCSNLESINLSSCSG
ncbi:MAG TPA: hypothetical protein VGP47_00325, partial [Parachlamydiaceae bacterium]|nr:hypothetical protein [Parachlamydiaceae bacterium]